MNKKIVVSLCVAALTAAPMLALADDSSSASSSAAGGLQVPSDWTAANDAGTPYAGFFVGDGAASSDSPTGFLAMPADNSGQAAGSDSGTLVMPTDSSQSSGMYPNGPRLIQLSGDSTVYWVSPNNLKIPMLSGAVFLSYNNKWSDVQTVQQDEFNYYPTAKFIWLNGNGAIYKIDVSTGSKQQITPDAWNNAGIDAGQIISVNKTDLNSYKTGSQITDSSDLQ